MKIIMDKFLDRADRIILSCRILEKLIDDPKYITASLILE